MTTHDKRQRYAHVSIGGLLLLMLGVVFEYSTVGLLGILAGFGVLIAAAWWWRRVSNHCAVRTFSVCTED